MATSMTINPGVTFCDNLGPGGSGTSYSGHIGGSGVTCYTQRERAIKFTNNASNALFIPLNTQAERSSVFYNISLNCSVDRDYSQYLSTDKNTMWRGKFSGGNWCWGGGLGNDNNSPAGCDSGWTDNGVLTDGTSKTIYGDRAILTSSNCFDTTTVHPGDLAWEIFIALSYTYWCSSSFPYMWLNIRRCSLSTSGMARIPA